MFQHCPKCGHSPLPSDQNLPAACPACGVILAKVVQTLVEKGEMSETEGQRTRRRPKAHVSEDDKKPTISEFLLSLPTRVDPLTYWSRMMLLVGFTVWGFLLIAQDYRTGEIGSSFIHRPLLIFHEAGHVVFRMMGEWMMILGGSLGQLIMPAILCGALLVKNRDPFGASIGLWFFGVSLLDLAPYMFDALHPQLMLLSGMTGEEGGHDWIFLFTSLGVLQKSQFIGGVVHKLGALVVLLALGWGALVLRMQYASAQLSDE